MSAIRTIAPRKLQRMFDEGTHIDLFDVRTPVEFEEVHIKGAVLKPLEQLDTEALAAERNGKPLYVICRTGGRADQACRRLHASGCTNVVNVEGGIVAWEKAGLPVERARQRMSLERQVRMVAGFLVVLGVVLAWQHHPAWMIFTAFIGAGMFVAGLTNACAMNLMLSRLPWNR